ncbi:MAG: hypothetical protein NTX49_02350 [Chlamydiae bacterium]|nr:hypothetical protein [Chlamydiota bacterium]
MKKTKALIKKGKVLPDFFTYTNRKKQVYFLHQKTTKKGEVSYYCSQKSEGNIVKQIPDGYEVWENPVNSRVFLRKQEERLITKKEETELKSAITKWCPISAKFDIRGREIIVYGSDADTDGYKHLAALLPEFAIPDFTQLIQAHGTYSPLLRFTLIDSENRIFSAERWCFRGSIDDWISLYDHRNSSLFRLCEKLLPHLGQESFYDII